MEKLKVVSTGADWLYGYDPSNGKELGKPLRHTWFLECIRPVAGNGMLFFYLFHESQHRR